MTATDRRERLRAFFARAEDPYAGGDLPTACRLGAALWVIATVFTWVLLPLSPPDAGIGPWGWPAALATTGAGILGARRLRSGRVSWDELYVSSYVAVAQIALLEWLAGGADTPYSELYLLTALYAGALHPPRRLLGVLAAIAVASGASLVYGAASAEAIGHFAVRIVLLSAVAMLASGLMRTVRAQRVGLRHRSDQAEREARVDALTGLPNRRAFGEAITVEISRANRFDAPLSLVVADLDSFKAVNDTHGHPSGDACLRAVADVLRTTLRQYDTCFRWGGDEFALLLPETSFDDAEAVCRRVTAAVAEQATPGGEPISITCAPAQLADGMDADSLVAAADALLLERKSALARA